MKFENRIHPGHSPSFHVAKVLKNELRKASALYGHMKIKASENALTKQLVFRTGIPIVSLPTLWPLTRARKLSEVGS